MNPIPAQIDHALPVDTHDMVVIHRAFRRESHLLAGLVAATRDGDLARAKVLARHARWYHAGLSTHHQGEDELIWPLLHARLDTDSRIGDGGVVAQMADQHHRLAGTLDRVMSAVSAWEATASHADRTALVNALAEHRDVLTTHLDDEEARLLPLASRHLTTAEWATLGDHFVASTPKGQLIIFLGAVLEDADPGEQASILSALPLPARIVWPTIGRRIYARHMRVVRGQNSR